MEKLVMVGNYCKKCKQEHNLPECPNFLYEGKCEICKITGITYFSGACCILKG